MLETDNYEKFKKDILQLAGIDLNSYKEKQMRRRINTLITKNNVKTYNDYPYVIDDAGIGRVVNTTTISGDLKPRSNIFEELGIEPTH